MRFLAWLVVVAVWALGIAQETFTWPIWVKVIVGTIVLAIFPMFIEMLNYPEPEKK